MEPIAYVNGKLTPLSEARIPLADRGFLYGDALFETLRTYNRIPFLLEEHIKRLEEGASYLKFNLSIERDDIVQAVYSVIEANSYGELYLRIILSRGSEGEGLLIPEKAHPTLAVMARPLLDYSREQRKGVKVIILKDRRGTFSFLKSTNFLPNLLARTEASKVGAFEALLKDAEGYIWEGTVSNLFIVKEDVLYTPPAGEKILSGVTRKVAMDLAEQIGVKCQEKLVNTENLFYSDEVLLTNSLIEIVPVTSIEGNKFPVGSITRALQAKYRMFTRNSADSLP